MFEILLKVKLIKTRTPCKAYRAFCWAGCSRRHWSLGGQGPEERAKTDITAALSSALGSAMFSTATQDSDHSGYHKQIVDKVQVLLQHAVIDETHIVEFHQQARELAAGAATSGEVRVKRQMQLRHVNRDIHIDVIVWCVLLLC